MTFLHKLAHRLARHRAGVAIAVAAVIACELPLANTLGTATSLLLSPRSSTLRAGQVTQFYVVGIGATGDTVVFTARWRASGGTIVDTGTNGSRHYVSYRSPDQPGRYQVVSQSMASTLADSAVVDVIAAPVASVTVLPATASLTPGQTLQLGASLTDSSGIALSGRVVTWGSSDPTVATVNGNGTVTAFAAGAATIAATSEGQSGIATVTVTQATVAVASVSITPASPSVAIGQTVQLTATPRDANGNALAGRVVTWSSSNPAVALVGGGGLVTGVAAGSTTITATSEGRTGSVSVTVTQPVASVSVTPVSGSIAAGQTLQLVATPRDANGTALTGRVVTWGSNNLAVATVNASGLVTGVAAGSVLITATSEGRSGSANVTVTVAPVASVSVAPASASLTAGQTVQLTATPRDASGNALTGRVVTWTTSSAPVATVNGSGLVSGVAGGSATITATSEGKTGTAAVSITQSPVPVASVTVTPASASVTAGQTVQLVATARDASGNVLTGRVVTWASGNTAAATVNSAGLVSGVAAGSATVTATIDGQSGTATITVAAAVASVSVSPATATVMVGQTVQLTTTVRDASGNVLTGRVVTWSSSPAGLVTVSGSGLVTGVGAGTATITATSEGKTGTASVTVTPPPVASVTVSPASPSTVVGLTVQLTATLRDASGNQLTGRAVTWGSNNTGVATVNGNGLVTAMAVGLATITATCEGKSGTSALTVAVAPPPDSTWPNEPLGYTTLTNLDFSVAIPTGGDHSYTDGWGINQSNLVTRQTDPTAPFSPQYVAQYSYPVGFTGSGTSPGNMYRSVPYGGYFVGFWWKYSNPWQFHSSGTNKIAFINAPVSSNLILFMDNSRHIVFQDIGDRNYLPNVNTTTLTPNVWHKIELLMEQSGRRVRVWVDGTLNVDASNVTNFPGQFTYFEFDPTWGGTGGSNKTEQDYFWYGHAHISHK